MVAMFADDNGSFLREIIWFPSAAKPIVTSDVCVCVCLGLYSSTSWFLPAAQRLWHTWEVRINNLLLWVFLETSAKFLHLYFWIYHILALKTKTPADHLLERKRYDIMFALKKMIYIDIGYKSAHYKSDSDRKILKIRRLLWSKFFHIESGSWHQHEVDLFVLIGRSRIALKSSTFWCAGVKTS